MSHVFLSCVQARVWDPGPVLRLLLVGETGRLGAPNLATGIHFLLLAATWALTILRASTVSLSLLPFAPFVEYLSDTLISAHEDHRYKVGVIGSFLKSKTLKITKFLGHSPSLPS